MRSREWSVALLLPLFALAACGASSDHEPISEPKGFEPRSLGAPCLGEDELRADFTSFAMTETVIYELSTTCDTRTCVANHFQGRGSCPYGQTEQEALTDPRCFLPDAAEPVTVPVDPQLLARRFEKTMTCSCRCAGPGDGPFCACPQGLVCEEIVRAIGIEPPTRAGSYCVPPGMTYDPTHPPAPDLCDRSSMNCGNPRPY